MKDIKFQVIYNNKVYSFQFGSQVYIFHTGLYNNMQRCNEKQLLQYVDFVHECYLRDSNRTPLGALADYVAENWEQVKLQGYYDVLEEFYSQD